MRSKRSDNQAGTIKFPFWLLFCCFIFLTGLKARSQQNPFAVSGSFLVGCNYWASHAGTHTWSDWKPDVIEADFKQLSANGIKVLRVFPLWPDFQPIYQIYAGEGKKKYIAFKEGPLPLTEAGRNGMSEEQLQHFRVMADLAGKYHLKLVVGLITGWMSGQLYVPPALEGRNILTDPESLSWQQKFITTFVGRFRDHPAILAWDFGNECNVMEKLQDHYQAYVWSSVISGAIRSADPSRPIISGMHSLSPANNAEWQIGDQAALTDVLTTHPYSLWTPYASQDGINTMRTILHGAAETRMYGDIGGKPCLTEETGVMGPMTGGETEKAAFARTALFSNWAHDCRGTFWWCAYDQTKLPFPPYIYSSVERELGLIQEDRTPKPVLNEFKKFSDFLDKLPFKELPQRKSEAVCILTEGQDNWAVAYSSFVLSKRAGFDFSFQKAGQELKDAKLYLLPSLKGIDPVFSDYWFRLLDKVKSGATLYISMDDAYLPTFKGPLGIELSTNIKRRGMLKYISKNSVAADSLAFQTSAERRYAITAGNNKVLAAEPDGNPVFLECSYGQGKIFLLTFPLEANVTQSVGSIDKNQPAYQNIYKKIAQNLISERLIIQDSPSIGITEHALNEHEKVVVMINYDPAKVSTPLHVQKGWEFSRLLYGQSPAGSRLEMEGNTAVVAIYRKK